MITPNRFANATLGAAPTLLYTCPVNSIAIIQALTLCNDTAGSVACAVWLVPSGGTPDATNIIASTKRMILSSGESIPLQEAVAQVLLAGGAIYAQGNGVTAVVSGVEQ